MFTLDNSTEPAIKRGENDLLAINFPTDATNLRAGAVVKLLSTGKVAAVTAATDVPIGIVEVYNDKYDNPNTVTVRTFGQAVVTVTAAGTIAIGTRVAATAWSGTTFKNTCAAAVSTNWAVGIALTAGTASNDMDVLMLRTPHIV